jgi:hypothetical protein
MTELERAAIPQRPEAIAADAGYWNEQQMDEVVADRHIPVLIARDKGSRDTPKRWPTTRARHGRGQCSHPSTVASNTRSKTDGGAALR